MKRIPIKLWDLKINRGILTGYDKAFIINKNKKDELVNLDPENKRIIHPIIRGKDIQRYNINFSNYYLIYSKFP